MHTIDLSLKKEITKVEGAATLDVKVSGGKVEYCRFGITEFKRFYTQAIRGKPYKTLPALLSRICGTCSNAHLLCSIEACEHALGITPTPQSQLMKKLTMYGLNIRDHALHLYLFALPDMYGKDAFLEFDEKIPEEQQLLHDPFEIKRAGNHLAIIIAGRSVHAINPTIGGFLKVPSAADIATSLEKLRNARPAVLRTIERFARAPFTFDRQTKFMAMVAKPFNFLDGNIVSDKGDFIREADFRSHLEHVVIPYSHASGYMFKGESYMVGALARVNLAQETLHPKTRADAAEALKRFPSTNIFDNNLAQAIEILHCIDDAIDIFEQTTFAVERPVQPTQKEGVGIGVVEAPRGTLYHKVAIGPNGNVIEGEIIVPTGQNQINIEQDMARRLEQMLPDNPSEELIQLELEKLIRAYDPCMSCGSHFLTLKIDAKKAGAV
ncbi:MAG: nickel-dependent hydrogenase large subunit [Patescibacteria group bacterium]|jgi:coenzyme F420-reducing hydrogenase alpha subunit